MRIKGKKYLAGILAASAFCGGLMLVTPGCGPEAQQVTAPEPTNNTPPGGGDPEEYARKMKEMQGGAGGAPGSPPGPGGPASGSPPPEAPPPTPGR